MLTGVLKLAFHAAAVDDYAPSSVLARMAESVQRLEYDRFVTVLCVRVGSKDTLEYANAGHPSGFVLSKDHTIVDLPSTGTVVHPMLPERSWPSRTARFARGDRLVIYSDGLVEAMGKDGVYGVEAAEARGRTADGGAARRRRVDRRKRDHVRRRPPARRRSHAARRRARPLDPTSA